MPLSGTLDLEAALAAAPTIDSLDPEPWTLPGTEVLQVSYEVAEGPALAVTPPGLHPSIPPYATFSFQRVPDSPVGPYHLAMVRLIVRAGIRPRGLLIKAFVDSEAAAEALRRGWGYDVTKAEVSFSRRHDEIRGAVVVDGEPALVAALEDPEPIAGADIELFDNLHLVNLQPNGSAAGGSAGEPLLVQVDPGYEHHTADRGRVRLDTFGADALGIVGVEPIYAVVGVTCRADMHLGPPRFVIDPRVPAVQGTRRLERSWPADRI